MAEIIDSELTESQKIKLLSPDDEQTRLIGKAIASETAGKILSLIAGREVTAMMLAEEMNTPVSTIMYHLENLALAGLIEVSRTRYSVKGREMKVYRLIDQVLIVSPKPYDLKTVLTRCGALLSLPLAVACLLAYLGLSLSTKESIPMDSFALGGENLMKMEVACSTMDRAMEASPAPMATLSPIVHDITDTGLPLGDIAIGILIGALLVILTGLVLDFLHRKSS